MTEKRWVGRDQFSSPRNIPRTWPYFSQNGASQSVPGPQRSDSPWLWRPAAQRTADERRIHLGYPWKPVNVVFSGPRLLWSKICTFQRPSSCSSVGHNGSTINGTWVAHTHTHTCAHQWSCQRTTCQTWFCPSTTWVPGLRLPDLTAGTFTSGAILLALMLQLQNSVALRRIASEHSPRFIDACFWSLIPDKLYSPRKMRHPPLLFVAASQF
jgi:hypothetical protein